MRPVSATEGVQHEHGREPGTRVDGALDEPEGTGGPPEQPSVDRQSDAGEEEDLHEPPAASIVGMAPESHGRNRRQPGKTGPVSRQGLPEGDSLRGHTAPFT